MSEAASSAEIRCRIHCFECAEGYYRIELQAYETTNGLNELLVVMAVPTHICNCCGDTILSAQACTIIEQARIAAGVIYRHSRRRA